MTEGTLSVSVSTNTGANGDNQSTMAPVTATATDHSPFITTHRLDGKNYLKWSKTVLMHIKGRGKGGYLTGETKAPASTDPKYQTWDEHDNLVRTWLINSMKPNIGENYILHPSAKAIWDAAKSTYSTVDNSSAMFKIEQQLFQLQQGEMDVTEYFNLLGHHWLHLDSYEAQEWDTPADLERFNSYIEKKRTLAFLLGLNQNLDGVKSHIMSTKPLPSLNEAFAEILREEYRRDLMVTANKTPQVESSALAVRNQQRNKAVQNSNQLGVDEEEEPYCDRCRRHGHTRAECWYLIGGPPGWKPRNTEKKKRAQAHVAETSEKPAETPPAAATPFSKEQANALEKFFKQVMSRGPGPSQNPTDLYSSLFASQGNQFHAYSVNSKRCVKWIIDSGCSDHMTGSREVLANYQTYPKRAGVRIADGSLSPVEGIGRVRINSEIELFPVLYVPTLTCNLVSISQLIKDLSCKAVFSSNQCFLQEESSGKTIGTAELDGDLFILEGAKDEDTRRLKMALTTSSLDNFSSQIMLWHIRLGHPSFGYLERLLPKLFLNKRSKDFQCDVCQLAKHTRSSYHGLSYRPTRPFAIIHSDIWGPTRIKNINGARWFVTFIDDHTRLTWTFLMREKSETTAMFQEFYDMILTQFNTKIQVLKTDNAHDYFNSVLGTYLSKQGIVHCSSCVDTPQQNGIAERKNRHLLETARALLFTKNVPKHLWGEAVLSATYLINRLPCRVLNYKTPKDILVQNYPHVQAYLSELEPRVFGCLAFVHIQPHQRSKLDPRARKCVFIGYAPRQKGYRCFCPTTRKIFTTMDVTFFEQSAYYSNPELQGESSQKQPENEAQTLNQLLETLISLDSPSIPVSLIETSAPNSTDSSRPNVTQVYQRRKKQPNLHISNNMTDNEGESPEVEVQDIEGELITQDENIETEEIITTVTEDTIAPPEDLNWPIAVRKGVRECTRHPIQRYVNYGRLSPEFQAFTTHLDSTPRSIEEAMKIPEWRKAVLDEIQALEANGTWKIVTLPPGKRTVDYKWIFTTKYNADGSVERYKARLVARGFTQSFGIDYQETFAPVAKLKTIRILLSIAANEDWPLHQMDVKNAFLNGHLTEEVYMEIPEGVKNSGNRNSVCKLVKSLYGLKQSPRAWFEKFSKTVVASGYQQCQTDDTMFVRHGSGSKIVILIVYVDDIIITGNDTEEIRRLKCKLSTEFELKDLGEMKYFLGMEVARSSKGIAISQRKYVLDLLAETGLIGCKPADTPMQTNLQFSKEGVKPTDRGRYQQLVGKLIYLSHTRPDIAFAVSIVSQFMNEPTEEHLDAVIHILRYLKKTPGLGLMFRKTVNRTVELYTDASWASLITSRKSTTGYCSYVWGNLVTWRSKKQSVVARSSAEAEYRALALGIQEAMWIQRVLKELNLPGQGKALMFCDSQAALSIVKNPVHHDRTKHVEIDRHFITEKVETGVVDISYVPSKQQTADILTKALSRDLLEHFKSKLGLLNIYTKLEGECRESCT
ncbi:Retrovirus-related Pol polyprotein from transposon TNT 1-94 [Linum grandiflorum]